MRGLPASPAFARQQRARQDQPVVLGEALAGAGFDDREPLLEVIEGSPGPLLSAAGGGGRGKNSQDGFWCGRGRADGGRPGAARAGPGAGLALRLARRGPAEARRGAAANCRPLPSRRASRRVFLPRSRSRHRRTGLWAPRLGRGPSGLAARRKRGFGGRRRFGYFGRGERGRAGLAKIRGRTLGAGTLPPPPAPCPLPRIFVGHSLG